MAMSVLSPCGSKDAMDMSIIKMSTFILREHRFNQQSVLDLLHQWLVGLA